MLVEVKAHLFGGPLKCWMASKTVSVCNLLLLHLSCEIFCFRRIVITCSMLPMYIILEHANAHPTVELYLPSDSLSFCLSLKVMTADVFFCCCMLVLIPAVTSAFCCLSSGKTDHIWPRPEFALQNWLEPVSSVFYLFYLYICFGHIFFFLILFKVFCIDL